MRGSHVKGSVVIHSAWGDDGSFATMECLFGITGKGFTVIASDGNAARSIVKMKSDEDKQKVLSQNLVMAFSGESGACRALELEDPYGTPSSCASRYDTNKSR